MYGVAKKANVYGIRTLGCQGSGTWSAVINGNPHSCVDISYRVMALTVVVTGLIARELLLGLCTAWPRKPPFMACVYWDARGPGHGRPLLMVRNETRLTRNITMIAIIININFSVLFPLFKLNFYSQFKLINDIALMPRTLTNSRVKIGPENASQGPIPIGTD